jgi:hypothetical protein
LSVAFTKEDSAETASETLLPDRPISPHPNLVTEAGLKALEFQLTRAREAYETAQKIEDVNERRRQAATPFAARVRTAQVIPILPQLTLLPLGARWLSGATMGACRNIVSSERTTRIPSWFDFLRIPGCEVSNGQSCWGCRRYIRSRAGDHCDRVTRPHWTQRIGMAALRQLRSFAN